MRIKSYAFGLSRNVPANCQWLFRGKRFRFPFIALALHIENGCRLNIYNAAKNYQRYLVEKLLCMYMKEKALK